MWPSCCQETFELMFVLWSPFLCLLQEVWPIYYAHNVAECTVFPFTCSCHGPFKGLVVSHRLLFATILSQIAQFVEILLCTELTLGGQSTEGKVWYKSNDSSFLLFHYFNGSIIEFNHSLSLPWRNTSWLNHSLKCSCMMMCRAAYFYFETVLHCSD